MDLRMGQRKKEDVTGDNVSQDVGGADCVELKGEGKESRLDVESASQQIHVLCMCMYECVGVGSYDVTEEEDQLKLQQCGEAKRWWLQAGEGRAMYV